MKTIKIAFYKLEPYKNKKKQSHFTFKSFQELLHELASKLDGDTNRQVINTNQAGLETSIWFDFINEKKYFEFNDICYFLLAKDVPSIMREDKKNNQLVHQDGIDDDIHLKIPTHFVFFPESNILGVEEIENGPAKSAIERAIKIHTKENIKFNAIHREDVIDRLNSFLEAIESVEFDMKTFSLLLKDIEADEYMNFLRTNNSKLIIKTFLDTEKSKKYVVELFSKLFNKKAENEILKNITNMSIKYKNEELKQEALSLVDNFLVFKKEREIYLEEFQNMEDNFERRKKYSKSIYTTIIDVYNEYNL